MSKQDVTVLPARPQSGTAAACCTTPDGQALDADRAESLAPMFKAMGDPVRLRLLSMIAAGGAETCVCDLTDAFEVSGPTISYHLKTLRQAGLVDCERRGTWVYYWIRPEALREMSALLAGAPQR
jgi:ArsR family transcriptional regulator